MKTRHRIPVDKIRWSDDVTPEYQAEVDRHTDRRMRDYARAERRLREALDRAEQAQATASRPEDRRTLADLWAEVDLRRLELEEIERGMTNSPQSTRHRGTSSHRPVPASPRSSLLP